MSTAAVDRVQRNTADSVNENIRRQIERNVARYSAAGPTVIAQRLAELDREWDVERMLETMAPSFSLVGLALGIRADKRFLFIPVVVQAFFLQHALQGWCPPLEILRRLGVRTKSEIDQEKYALKAVRGDFREVAGPGHAYRAVAAAH